jgi:hypothetical protein
MKLNPMPFGNLLTPQWVCNIKAGRNRHSGEGRNPDPFGIKVQEWIPAFAGMTRDKVSERYWD